jgi:hypothetical protein
VKPEFPKGITPNVAYINFNLFNVKAADYNYFEGITFRNTDIAIWAGTHSQHRVSRTGRIDTDDGGVTGRALLPQHGHDRDERGLVRERPLAQQPDARPEHRASHLQREHEHQRRQAELRAQPQGEVAERPEPATQDSPSSRSTRRPRDRIRTASRSTTTCS